MANNQQDNQHHSKHQQKKHNQDKLALRTTTPMIVERFSKFPVVNLAINLGYTQYDRLKSSNVTVGEVMTKAEGWAVYMWQKFLPIVDKFQEPINKADKLACNTLDFVEGKLQQVSQVVHHQKSNGN